MKGLQYYPPEDHNAWACPVFRFCMKTLFVVGIIALFFLAFGSAYAMNIEILEEARVILEATSGIPSHQIEIVLARLEQFNTLEQADVYNALMAKCERYHEKAQPANRKKFLERIEELKQINSEEGSLEVIIVHLGDRTPTKKEIKMAEKYLGIPAWFER